MNQKKVPNMLCLPKYVLWFIPFWRRTSSANTIYVFAQFLPQHSHRPDSCCDLRKDIFMFHSDYEGTGQKDILLVFTLGTNLDCKKAHIQSLPAFPPRLKTVLICQDWWHLGLLGMFGFQVWRHFSCHLSCILHGTVIFRVQVQAVCSTHIPSLWWVRAVSIWAQSQPTSFT